MKKLNLGCGEDLREGYINFDKSPNVGADVVGDMHEPLPFEDNLFHEVMAYNSLTQMESPKAFRNVMNELWRVTKEGGDIFIRVPMAPHPCAFQDVFDTLRFTPESFTYMELGHRRYKQYGRYYGYKPFYVSIVDDGEAQKVFSLSPVK